MEVNRKSAAKQRQLRLMAQAALETLGQVDLGNVPVERIAEVLGISRATFFRHFVSKDQLVILAFIGDVDEFAVALASGAIAPATSIWPTLRTVFEPLILAAEADDSGLRRRLSLLRERPLLSIQLRRARLPQIEALAQALTAQGVEAEAALNLSGAAISALDRCIYRWAGQPGAALRPLIDNAFLQLERGY